MPPARSLALHNVVVTGGSRGIGLGIATALAQSGYEVIAIARRLGPALELAMAQHTNLQFFPIDLTDLATLPEHVRRLRNQVGPIYGLVNNAGIGTAGILSTMPDEQIAQVLQTNVIAPITLTKYVLRSMMAARAGRVVNIASVVASAGYSGLSAYSASKAAMVGFTRSLAREVGSLGVTVNAVAPGFIATEMTHGLTDKQRQQIERRSALQRMATVEEVAAAVEFLMSDRAAAITGTVMTVDAGNTA
jgi:3-oxoacyl-[acyl-carrier protein] reductase